MLAHVANTSGCGMKFSAAQYVFISAAARVQSLTLGPESAAILSELHSSLLFSYPCLYLAVKRVIIAEILPETAKKSPIFVKISTIHLSSFTYSSTS